MVSLQSEFSMVATPSKRVAPLTYISLRTAFLRMARLNCAISTLERDISAPSKLLPSTVASKNDDPTRFDPLKLEFLTMDCWKATPFRFWLAKSELSRLTPRVMAMVRPDWSVDAPPVVILALALLVAPFSAEVSAKAGGGGRPKPTPRTSDAARAAVQMASPAVWMRLGGAAAGRPSTPAPLAGAGPPAKKAVVGTVDANNSRGVRAGTMEALMVALFAFVLYRRLPLVSRTSARSYVAGG